MLSHSRRGLAALFTVVLCLVVSSCGTGFSAQTNKVYTAGDGSNHRVGSIQLLNALFVINEDNTATFSAGLIDKASQPDRVASVDVARDDKKIAAELVAPIELKPEQLFTAGKQAEIVIRGKNFAAGDFVDITLTFANAAPVTLSVPIVLRTEEYAGIATAPPPTR